MLNYRQNTSVLIKFDLKIVHYFLHQICLRLLAFFDIWTSHDENLWIKQVKGITETERVKFQEFINAAIVHELSDDIVDGTIEIRKHHKTKLPDAVIAATALVNKLTIITRNTKDFIRIEGLEMLNPYEIWRKRYWLSIFIKVFRTLLGEVCDFDLFKPVVSDYHILLTKSLSLPSEGL